MKLKVLLILPVLIINAIWWAPLAVANNPAPAGGGELEAVPSEKIIALEKEIADMQVQEKILKNKLIDAENELALKKNQQDLALNYWSEACASNSKGSVCAKFKEKYEVAIGEYVNALASKNSAFSTWKAQEVAIKNKQDELKILKSNTGADSQGISNYQPGGTILPDTAYQLIADCEAIMRYVNNHPKEIKKAISERQDSISGPSSVKYNYAPSYTDIMGCAIKTGDVKLWMVPYFARYILEFIIAIAGLASVAGIVYGGYLYLFAGLSDDQQKGKNAIKNSIIALVLSLSAWAIVNIVMSLVTAI